MKYCIFGIMALTTAMLYGNKLIYDSGISRQEIMLPVSGYLLVDTMGNCTTIPDIEPGKAIVLYHDNYGLCYKITSTPNDTLSPNSLLGNYSPTAQKAHDDYINEFAKLTQEQRERKIKERQKQIDAERAIIDRERAKLNSGYYEEEKRRANEELRKLGYK